MQNFNFLTTTSTLGICAPSAGCGLTGRRRLRCENAIKKFNKLGHNVVLAKNCFNNTKMRSCSAQERAKEFESLFFDDTINAIIAIGGGEFELEILPYLDFERLTKSKNKIFQGFSDNTCISFLFATICEKISIYGQNFGTFGMNRWHKSILDNYNFLLGKNIEQVSFKMYESKTISDEQGAEYDGFKLTRKTSPKILTGQQKVEVKGRTIGGCLDILVSICGTKFDNVKKFCKKYNEDGIIWFFESCDLNIPSQLRAIWQLKNAGWFDNAKAILIGRPQNKEKIFDIDYIEANYEHLKDLNIPIVIDLDIGHTNPIWFMVNGGLADFKCDLNVAKLSYIL